MTGAVTTPSRKPAASGRPREASDGEARTAELRVRLTPEELRRLRLTARRLGVDVSDLVRSKLDGIINR